MVKVETLKNQMDDKELFSLLMEQNHLDLLIEWINYSFASSPKAEQQVDTTTPAETATTATLYVSPMTQAMVDELSSNKHLVANYSNEILLNNLAK